jgi:hypothetical protein
LLFDQFTCDTPTLSDAEPLSATVADEVENAAPAAGDVMSTAGGTIGARHRQDVGSDEPCTACARSDRDHGGADFDRDARHGPRRRARGDAGRTLSVDQLTCVTERVAGGSAKRQRGRRG